MCGEERRIHVHGSIQLPLHLDQIGRNAVFPSTDIREVAEKIVQQRSNLVENQKAFLNDLLTCPLQMLDTFQSAINPEAKSENRKRCER